MHCAWQAYCPAIRPKSLKQGIEAVATRLERAPRVAEYIRERRLIYEETRAEAEGRTRGRSHQAWPATPRGAPRMQPYTREEVIRAVRRCALELACRPSSTTYVRWSAGKRRLARVNNSNVHSNVRVPSIGAVYRHFPSGGRARWRRVLEAAALSDEELTGAFTRRLGSAQSVVRPRPCGRDPDVRAARPAHDLREEVWHARTQAPSRAPSDARTWLWGRDSPVGSRRGTGRARDRDRRRRDLRSLLPRHGADDGRGRSAPRRRALSGKRARRRARGRER
jgi:hypothetical protein